MHLTRFALIPSLLALTLTACGGGDDTSTSSQPEPTRPQDARTFAVSEAALPLAALSGAPETDRWWGTNKGAGYQIEVPKNWNGMLVMYAHGYGGTGSSLFVTTPSIRRHLISQAKADDKLLEHDEKTDPRFAMTAAELEKKGVKDFQLDYAIKTLKRLAPGAPSNLAKSR